MNPRASICPVPGCGALTTGGRCHQHAAADNSRRHAKQRDHGRNTAAWRHKRLARLEHDDYACQRCGRRATTVHIDPAWEGDHSNVPLDALTSLCSSCHGTVDAPRATRRNT